jgi:hypothetical protein
MSVKIMRSASKASSLAPKVSTSKDSNMKVRFAFLLTLLSLLVQGYPAMASWGSFVSLGTNTVNSDPSCAPVSGGDAVCAARSFANTMLVNQFNGTAWAGWKNLAGAISSGPSCAPDGNGQVICAARASNGGFVYTVFNGTTWSTERQGKASLATGLSCATLGGGRVLCAARSVTGGLTSAVFNGTIWSAFDNQAANTTSAPGCATDDAGRVVCMMQDTSSSEIANRYNGASWDGFINTGGEGTGEPTCSNFGVPGEVVCFARSTFSAFFGNRFTGGAWAAGNWTGWTSGNLGGVVGAKGACVSNAASQLVCGVFGVPDSALWVDVYNGTSWSGFTRLGQTTVGNPSCAPLGGGKVMCAVVNVNNKVSSIVGP